MKEIWIETDLSPLQEQKTELLQSTIQSCDVILVNEKDLNNAKKFGIKIASTSEDADIIVLSNFDTDKIRELKNRNKVIAIKMIIKDRTDEEIAVKAADLSCDYIIVSTPDWRIIPLENLIAKTRGKTRLLAEVTSNEEAKVALETLELGTDGVLLKIDNFGNIKKIVEFTRKKENFLVLVPVEVTAVKEISTGARVCIDTIELMKPGEGLLLGCQSNGLFLVEAEVHKSPYVETRPFRVNAGPLSLYVLTSQNETKYLSELESGQEVLIVNRKGNLRVTNVARAKIEWRPLLLIEGRYGDKTLKLITQNAETIRVVNPDSSCAVTNLKKGDRILALVIEGGRHFGTLVKDEAVIER
jgi:3-dehydroquinate synthase II